MEDSIDSLVLVGVLVLPNPPEIWGSRNLEGSRTGSTLLALPKRNRWLTLFQASH